MKYNKLAKLLFTITFIFIFYGSFAQVKIDTTKDYTISLFNINYKVHIFKSGESLYSLSKVYHTPLEQIIAYNNFKDTITPGTEIKIPIGDFPHKSLTDTVICCLHKVKRRESLQTIAQKYGITPELIVKFNPQIRKKGLRRRHYIRIPEIKFPKDIQDSFFFYHVYRRGETPEILSIYYSIPTDDILEFNNDSSFTDGRVIIIPKKHYNPNQISILRADYITLPDLTGLNRLYGQPPENPPCETYKYSPDTQFNVALILPFFINENYFALQDVNPRKPLHLYDNTKYFYDYLFGTLMALDELKQLGINVNLHIYDSRNSDTKIRNILDRDEMAKMDLIIGPAYSKHYKIIRDYAQLYGVSFVAPFSRRESVLDSNPNVFLANPSDNKLVERVAQYIAPAADTANIIVFYNFDNSQKLANIFTKKIKAIAIGELGKDSLNLYSGFFDPTNTSEDSLLFDKKRTNYVVIPVSNEVFVNGVLNFLNTMYSLGYPIVVFGMPSWQYFKNFDLQWLLNLNVHFPSAYFLDNNNPEVQVFIDKYLALFHDMPNYYSYLGYDITQFFIHALKQYGKTFQYCLSQYAVEPASHGIYMNFAFKKDTVTNGYENNAVFMLYYDKNLKLHKIETLTPINLEQK